MNEGAEHGINWWGVGQQYTEAPALGLLSITFVIFVAGLVWFVRPKLMTYLENRSDAVKKAIDEAKRAKEAAEARAKDAEMRLQNLEQETAKMRADFESQGKAEAERLEKLAQETAARIARDAEETIGAEADRARAALRAEAAKLALEMAEERIKAALNGNDDARLQKALVDGLNRPSA
jgi:F-type H+-transporting ATPase subunit b